ncbi:MAG: hypothetical protein QOH06_4127 [Acidobacteriota bacterium]|jgi:type 2 lantibiotic biosynthesis protein LanM|nr:hypothetical protein [Acidobacteriota bacterium]
MVSSSWPRSLHLTERASAAGAVLVLPERDEAEAKANTEPLLEAWRNQTPFHIDEWFHRRLEQDGLTPETLARLLSLGDEDLGRMMPVRPPWEERLEEAYSASVSQPLSQDVSQDAGGFTPLVRPLIDGAWKRLRKEARELKERFPAAPFDPDTVAALLWTGMADRLDWMLSRSVVLDLYIAKLQGPLAGDTPEERFRNFVEQLSSPPRALAFFHELPVLARIVVETLDLWEEVSRELLVRLCRDWPEILVAFHPQGDPGPLTEMSGGAGDLHRGGRSVRILTFQSGFRLIYKPRALRIESRFAELLDWLNERGAPGLTAARVLEREGYGWMELIAHRPCATREELERFYRRQGAFLALFHALNANDLHRENLIASGEHPVFIDLECVLSPDYGQFDPETYDSLAQFEMNDTVIRVMLLPFFHDNGRQDIIDPSGLGGDEGQLSVYEVPVWENPGTDEMRLTQGRPPVSAADNRPSLGGRTVNPIEFREQLEEGFASVYRLLVRHREELLGEGSPLSRFADTEVRIVFRASQMYAFILNESYHPELLRDAVERDRHFDHLWFGIDRSKLARIALRLFPIEREDLWRGDLPYFSALGGSRDVRGSSGQLIPDLLARSALEMAEARLRQLDEADLGKQLWYVRASLTALAIELQSTTRPDFAMTRLEPAPESGDQRGGLFARAAALSDRIGELALRRNGAAAWIGLAKTRGRGWWLRPLDADLYSGLPGVALYLARSGDLLGRPEDTRLAREALADLDRMLARRERVAYVGGFDGYGGLVYTWLSLGLLWQDSELVDKAVQTLPKIAALIDGDEDIDIVRGCAGGLVPLLGLYRHTGEKQALELARRMGDRLVDKALPYGQGICWHTASFPVHPLTGFSHGTAGGAWALLELFGVTGDERYRQTAALAIAFENQFFSPRERNWQDLRNALWDLGSRSYADIPCNTAWCHGASGIGLSRLRAVPHLPEAAEDVRLAVEATLRTGFGVNHCLCHGDMGNLELLLQAGDALGNPEWLEAAGRITRQALAAMDEKGYLCGVPFYVETPGLMEGLAGIGYGLLRLAEPERVPCVLLLDLP